MSASLGPWDRNTEAGAQELADDLWRGLRMEPRSLTLERLHSAAAAPANDDGNGDDKPVSCSLLLMPDATNPTAPPRETPSAEAQINEYLDSYALHSRLDAVDEAGRPFVPFVRPITPREMQRFEYGIMLDTTERTVLVQHQFREPREHAAVPTAEEDQMVRQFDGVISNKYVDVFLLQQRVLPVFPPKPRREINPMVDPAVTEAEEAAEKQPEPEAPAQPTSAPEPMCFRVGFVPCFRLRFRQLVTTDNAALKDAYVLSAVLVSGHRFYDLHDDLRRHVASAPGSDYYSRINSDNSPTLRQRQEAWAAWVRLSGGSVLSDPREAPSAHQVIVPSSDNAVSAKSESTPSRAAAAAKVKPLECGFTVPGAGVYEDVDEAVVADAPPSSAVNCGEDFVPRRCEYTHDRMATRVSVVERVPGRVPEQWAQLCASLGMPEDDAKAARVVMKDTRHGVNAIESGELTAFVPTAPSTHAVYGTSSEEQLRLWIGGALATAEAAGLRLVMFRLDLPMIVSRCTGLLSLRDLATLRGELGENERPVPAVIAAREYALRIVLETVEDFVQGSGVIWRAVVMVDPAAGDELPPNWTEFTWGIQELERIMNAKREAEKGVPRHPSPTRGATRERKPKVVPEDDIKTLSPARRGRSAGTRPANDVAAPPGGTAFQALGNDEVGMERELPVPRSYLLNPLPTESDLRRVFKRLDRSGDGLLNREELRRLLLPPDDASKAVGVDLNVTDRGTYAPRRAQTSYLSCGTVLSPIDECGVPLTAASVDQYLDKYSRQHKGKITYQEFCCMMLDIARR